MGEDLLSDSPKVCIDSHNRCTVLSLHPHESTQYTRLYVIHSLSNTLTLRESTFMYIQHLKT